jgi:hypothetical protein
MLASRQSEKAIARAIHQATSAAAMPLASFVLAVATDATNTPSGRYSSLSIQS